MSDLFDSKPIPPLAEVLRPQKIDELIGQTHLLGIGKPLYLAFQSGQPHSMILWGPPGIGKTTIARLSAQAFARSFIAISAVLAGVKEIREAIEQARHDMAQFGKQTILFVDEIHRFNKSQQDALLPHLESGLFTLIGATTENPSFEVNSALLSRAQVYVLKSLNQDELAQLLERDPGSPFEIEKPMVDALKASENTYEANAVYQTALVTFPDIKLAEYRTLAAKKGVSVARGGFSPRIRFGGNLSTGYSSGRIQLISGSNPPAFEKIPLNDQLSSNYSRGVGMSLNIPLWNGNQARSVVNRAKISYQNANLSEQLAKNNLNKVINQALYDLKAAQKRFESTQSAYNSSKEAFNVVEQRYAVGLVNTLDYYQTQVNLNKAAFDVIQAKYDLLFKTKVIDFYLGKPINF